MPTRKFISFLRPIIIFVLLKNKLLATNSTNVGLQASAGKTTFASVLNKDVVKRKTGCKSKSDKAVNYLIIIKLHHITSIIYFF